MKIFIDDKVKFEKGQPKGYYANSDFPRNFRQYKGDLVHETMEFIDRSRINVVNEKSYYLVAVDVDADFNVVEIRPLTWQANYDYRQKVNGRGCADIYLHTILVSALRADAPRTNMNLPGLNDKFLESNGISKERPYGYLSYDLVNKVDTNNEKYHYRNIPEEVLCYKFIQELEKAFLEMHNLIHNIKAA